MFPPVGDSVDPIGKIHTSWVSLITCYSKILLRVLTRVFEQEEITNVF